MKPKRDTDTEVYRNRHGSFSINVQAICNPDLSFSNVVAKWKGSTHDSRIFDNSRIMVRLRDGDTPPRHLVGDGGYPSRTYCLIPYRRPATPAQERFHNFNYFPTNVCSEFHAKNTQTNIENFYTIDTIGLRLRRGTALIERLVYSNVDFIVLGTF